MSDRVTIATNSLEQSFFWGGGGCEKVAVAQLATNRNTRFITVFTKDRPWILL
jgi:replication-associated recombination protein RarA